MHYELTIFGQAYNNGTYGSGTYQDSTSTNTGTGHSSGGGNGVLTNTGFDLVLAATVACVLILAAVVIRFWKRSAKTK